MRLIVYTFCLPAIAATGWKLGAWCGDGFTQALDHYIDESARKTVKRKLTAVS